LSERNPHISTNVAAAGTREVDGGVRREEGGLGQPLGGRGRAGSEGVWPQIAQVRRACQEATELTSGVQIHVCVCRYTLVCVCVPNSAPNHP